jgi:uncharacterized protein YjbJ (UPF0337 family)
MNWEQAKGTWNQLKAELKAKWSRLTDNDLEIIGGKRDQLVSKLQERYSIPREEAERQVNQWDPAIGLIASGDPKRQRKVG